MIKFILATVLLLIVLGLLGVNVRHDVAGNQNVQDNISYVSSGAKNFWENYLSQPARFLWNDVFVNILWDTFVRNMERLKNGETPTDFTNPHASELPSIPGSINKYGADPNN